MKRDLDLLRRILAHIEETDQIGSAAVYEVESVVFDGHVALLVEAGLIEGIEFDEGYLDDPTPQWFIKGWLRLTNAGHDFIDAARDDTVWQEAKDRTGKVGGAITLAVMAELLKDVILQRLGIRDN